MSFVYKKNLKGFTSKALQGEVGEEEIGGNEEVRIAVLTLIPVPATLSQKLFQKIFHPPTHPGPPSQLGQG